MEGVDDDIGEIEYSDFANAIVKPFDQNCAICLDEISVYAFVKVVFSVYVRVF